MTKRTFETTSAFAEVLDVLKTTESAFLEGDRAVDDLSVLEGYRWLTETLSVACECYLWADPARPSIVPIAGPDLPTRKWGGDNSDSFYCFAPLDPRYSYRVRGTRRGACYLSLTVYGGPGDGRWSDRLVATLNDRTLAFDGNGRFEVVLSAEEPATRPANWMRLEPDSVALLTRDYLVHPLDQQRATWHIEALDPAPPPRLDDDELARRFRAVANFLRELANISPVALDGSLTNTVGEPYPVPKQTYGWAAGDASYAMGAFELRDGEALIIKGRSPRCAFWNFCLWNPYMQTYDYRYERVTINGGQIEYEQDGSWRIVVAAVNPGSANWVSTAGHAKGLMWFRWFLAEELPTTPTTKVVRIDTAAA